MENQILVSVDLRTAHLIRKVFLPSNPNKMRNAHPEVRQADNDFIAQYERAALNAPREALVPIDKE
jgi:hypothetical protein